MLMIWEGKLDDTAQLHNEIVLTGQDQAALANSILMGAAVLRVNCGELVGGAAATLERIECSWFDNWADPQTSGPIWRRAEDLAMANVGSDSDLGSFVELEGPVISAKCLACYPTMIRLVWSNVVLGPAAYIDNFRLGIMLSNYTSR